MNFVTYLVARFAVGILGGLLLIPIVMLLPLLLVLAPFGRIWMVYDEWKEFIKEDDV